jgi:phosphosulfolactate synthase
MKKAWEGVTEMPCGGRPPKPRKTGLTMVIDKGIGMYQLKDLIQTSGEYIDILKLTFGTSAFYAKEFLRENLDMMDEIDMSIRQQTLSGLLPFPMDEEEELEASED